VPLSVATAIALVLFFFFHKNLFLDF